MRKIAFLPLLALSILGFVCCQKNSPEQTAIDFCTAIDTQNFDRARELCGSSDLDAILQFVENAAKEDEKSGVKKDNSKKEPKYEVTRTEGTDTIRCYLVNRNEIPEAKDQPKEHQISVAKIEGVWKVVDMGGK